MFCKKWALILYAFFPALFPVAGEEIKYGGLVFEERPRDGLVITKYEGGASSLVIPEQVDGKPVTEIDLKVFYYLTDNPIQEVRIPKTITRIGFFNFAACPSLRNICVDEENPVFSSKNGILFNKNQTVLIQAPCGLSGKYIIPDTVKELGPSAFYGCSKIVLLVLPKSFESYGANTFGSSTIVPASYKLELDPENPRFSTSNDGFLLSKDETKFLMCTDKLIKKYKIPQNIKTVGKNAFGDCREMREVSIPENIEQIEDSAFAYCYSLGEVELPPSLQSIGDRAFYGCDFKTINIPDGVKTIGPFAFARCEKLEKITIPKSVQHIPERLFWKCNNLRKVEIEEGVKSVGAYFVEDCERLRDVDVPSSVSVSPSAWRGSPLDEKK